MFNQWKESWFEKQMNINNVKYMKTFCPYCKIEHSCTEIDYLSEDNDSIFYCNHYEDHFRM